MEFKVVNGALHIFNEIKELLMKCIAVIFICIFGLLQTSCSEDGDDINAILGDKLLKVTGCVYNGVNVNGEAVKEFYSNPYIFKMSSAGSFECELTKGSHIYGLWQANGNTRSIKLDVKRIDGVVSTELGRHVYEIVENAQRYSGDSNVLKFYKDSRNFITLNVE